MTGIQINDIPYYGFVYMWCDTIRNKFYIGSHYGKLDDGYTASGLIIKRILKKRRNTCYRYILELSYNNDRKDVLQKEQKWLDFYSVKDNNSFYNIKQTANGGSGTNAFKGVKKSQWYAARGIEWIDPRKGKSLDDIYDQEYVKTIKERASAMGSKGYRRGTKSDKVDFKKGKTVLEIYGYYKVANPPKPFNVSVHYPTGSIELISCNMERDFFEKTKLDPNALCTLKRTGQHTIKRILPNTKHNYPKGTIVKFIKVRK